jgi:hypothetical protein
MRFTGVPDTMTDRSELRRKLRANVRSLGERYFVDATEEQVGAETVEHWKLTLGALTYLSARNVLLVGEPGTGKNDVRERCRGRPLGTSVRSVRSHTDSGSPGPDERGDAGAPPRRHAHDGGS